MFKGWKSEKKVKVVFKLQFVVTQVPPLKKPALTVSLIPEEVGRPTVKLEKAAVKDGICSWENPVFETMKLVWKPKTGILKEKIYHFIVSAGSSKSGYLGESSIDFAEFAAETEPMTISLPLKFANSGAVLHVTIQKMHEANDQRDDKNGTMLSQRDSSLSNQLSICDVDDNSLYYSEEGYQTAENDGSFRALNGSNSTSDSGWNMNSVHKSQEDFELDKTIAQQDSAGFLSLGRQRENNGHQRTNTDWSVGSASERSLVESTNSSEDSILKEAGKGASDASTEKLKHEMSMLTRQTEMSELEIQSLRKQIAKENKRGENLSAQITDLKEERDELRTECERLRSLKNSSKETEAVSKLKNEMEKSRVLLEETRQELNNEREMNENLQLQLQKTQELNANLILAVKDLEEILEQKNMEISEGKENHNDQEVEILKKKIEELHGEIGIHRKQREELDMHIEQLILDYDAMKEEKHDITLKLEKQQQKQKNLEIQCTDYLNVIRELETEVQRLEEETRNQEEKLSESLTTTNHFKSQVEDLERVLVEQEGRATQAEEALRRTREKAAETAATHEDEFRRLSVEMASKIDENEKLIRKAVEESNELCSQKNILEEALQKANEEMRLIKAENEAKQQELLNRMEQISVQLDEKSMQLGSAQKHAEEKQKTFMLEIEELKGEIERITRKKNDFSDEAEEKLKLRDELAQLKKSVHVKEMQEMRWSDEIDKLGKELASANKKAEKAQDELNNMKSMKVEKETMITNLHLEVQKLRAQQNDLNHSLVQEKSEKENLLKQVSHLKGDLQKKEEQISSLERRLRSTSNKAEVSKVKNDTVKRDNNDGRRKPVERFSHLEMNTKARSSVKNKTDVKAVERREGKGSEEKAEAHNNELLNEMALLKERNKSMESELKELQVRYSEISLKFAEVEGERQQLVMTVRNLKNGKRN